MKTKLQLNSKGIMMFRYIFLILVPLVIQCENVSNSSTFEFDSMVISPYRHVFTLLKSDIVNKLMNVNPSFSNLAYELHCTVEEIQSSSQETTEDNQKLFNQVSADVDELVKSISQLENETREAEMLMNELNKTVETTREHVRLEEIAAEKARRYFLDISKKFRGYSHVYGSLLDNCESDTPYRKRFGRTIVLSSIGRQPAAARCHFVGMPYPWYKSSAKAMHDARNKLETQKQQLKEEIAKYNATQLQLTNISQQLNELNNSLQEQQIMKALTDSLNKEFQLITNRLKTGSTSSKRLIDVLMYVLDYGTIVKPLNSIYDKLFNENLIESKDLKLSEEIMNQTKEKLLLMTIKSPQLRYRRKQFHHPCVNRTRN